MNKILALGLGFGVAAHMVIGLACGNGGGPASPEPEATASPPPAEAQVMTGISGEAPGDTSPPSLHGDPGPSLTYEGAVYYQEALSSAEAANLNEDELELVGSTNESNTLSPNSGESLKIYRLKDGDAYQVYTLAPGSSFQDEGRDGSTITIEPEWRRWSASNEADPVASGFILPRPGSVDELVGGAQVIVVGTIESVIEDDTPPPSPQGAPRASLSYEGAVYHQEALSSAEAANLNENELELVGSTTDSNTLRPNSGESLKIYGLKNGEAYQVYTLTPGRSFQNEDGGRITIEPEWTRWSASN